MKTKNIILAIIFLGLAVVSNAQPLPPTSPSGNPVPVDGMLTLLIIVFSAMGIFKLRKQKQ